MENWFKVSADVFDSKKIKIIRAMRNGDSMALLWFFLLSVARQQNDAGYIYATEGVAYTPKTLAAVSGFKPKLVETALEVFQTYNMIEVDDNGYIYIVGWEEYQNAEELAKIKERQRCKEAMRAKRQQAKANVVTEESRNNGVTVTKNDCNNVVTVTEESRNNGVTNDDVTPQNKSKNKNKEDIRYRESNKNIEKATSLPFSTCNNPVTVTENIRNNGVTKTQEEMDLQQRYFNLFWEAYPKKVNQSRARYAWESVPIDEKVYNDILQAVRAYSKTKQWQDKMYVPNAENFIGDERWKDEIPISEDNHSPTTYKKNDVEGSVQEVIARLRARKEAG